MACINMFNPDSHASTPRISFSNDFILDPSPPPPARVHDQLLTDPDFEFGAVGARPMIAADELFFKGKMVPLREEGRSSSSFKGRNVTTLRDELCVHDTDDTARPPKYGMRWKEFLGLKKGTGLKKISETDVPDVTYATDQGSDGRGRAKDADMGFDT